jgi:hypothetical protein
MPSLALSIRKHKPTKNKTLVICGGSLAQRERRYLALPGLPITAQACRVFLVIHVFAGRPAASHCRFGRLEFPLISQHRYDRYFS